MKHLRQNLLMSMMKYKYKSLICYLTDCIYLLLLYAYFVFLFFAIVEKSFSNRRSIFYIHNVLVNIGN